MELELELGKLHGGERERTEEEEEELGEAVRLVKHGNGKGSGGSSDAIWTKQGKDEECNEVACTTLDEEIEDLGEGWYHRRMVAILGLGNASDAVEILSMGYLLPVYSEAEGELLPWQSGLLTSAVFVGMLLGGLFGGILSDRLGRRSILLFNLALNGCSAIMAAISPSIYWLIFFRTTGGIGVGGTVSCLFALCVEHLPSKSRGFYVTILCSFWMVGSITTSAVAWIMLGSYIGGGRILNISWRWFAAFVSLPSFACFLLTYKYVPESARFLFEQGKYTKATKVLIYIRKVNRCEKPIRLQELVSPSSAVGEHVVFTTFWRETVATVRTLFTGNLFRITSTLLVVSFCQSFGSYGLATWITKLYKSVGMTNPFANSFLFAASNLPGNIASAYLIDTMGRKRLLSFSMLLASLCVFVFAYNINGSAAVIIALSCAFNAFATSAWNALGVVSVESFPLQVRGSGNSILNGMGRVGAITAQFINGYLVSPPANITGLLLVASCTMLVGGLTALSFPALGKPRPA